MLKKSQPWEEPEKECFSHEEESVPGSEIRASLIVCLRTSRKFFVAGMNTGKRAVEDVVGEADRDQIM